MAVFPTGNGATDNYFVELAESKCSFPEHMDHMQNRVLHFDMRDMSNYNESLFLFGAFSNKPNQPTVLPTASVFLLF
jgi:hypothetical protein